MTTKAKVQSRPKRQPRFSRMTLGGEWLIRVLEGLPTKRLEREILRRREEETKRKQARAAKK